MKLNPSSDVMPNVSFCFVQFLILATDGVWDVTEIGQAVQIVQVRRTAQTSVSHKNMGSTSTYVA